jgi:23S rRNA pseudouridine2605 synthase
MKAEKVEIESINKSKKTASLKLDLCTGYNRQIRKMCDKMGLEILKLVRIRIGKLCLNNLDLQIGKAVKIDKGDIL